MDPVDYNVNDIAAEPADEPVIGSPQEPLSKTIPGLRGSSTIYIDRLGFVYYQHSIRGNNRYLRCENRRYGCPVSAKMATVVGAPILISPAHEHRHEPIPNHAVELRGFMNILRERGNAENIVPQNIVDQEAHQYPRAAMEVGRPAAVRAIARARRRNSPPVPETLRNWVDIFNSNEWGPRLRNVNGTMAPFYQGPLEILNDDGSVRFVGIVFTNNTFVQEINVHLNSVRTICMDGTFQIRPRQPADINQLFTIQIIFNNVAIPIVHALMVDRNTESYCRLLQFVRNELQLNIDYTNIQIITDFEQGLRNAIARVLPEANNSGCWFHYIQSIIRYVRSHQMVNLCTINENARQILRMLMALAHLPSTEQLHHGNAHSIQLGFRLIQDLVTDYNLEDQLADLMRYYERYWMDTVTPRRFTVFRLQYRTNNYIESYHASLLRLMGQHPTLYGFYDHLRTVEERGRNDFSRAVNGQRVRQADYRVYPRNDITIQNAWINVENGNYNLSDFIRNVAYTPEQIIRNEIGEPNFPHQAIVPGINIRPLAPPAPLPRPAFRPLILGPVRPPPHQPLLPPQPIVQPPAVLPMRPLLPVQPIHIFRPLSPGLEEPIRPPSPEIPIEEIVIEAPQRRGPGRIRGRGRMRHEELDRPYPIDNRGRGRRTRVRRVNADIRRGPGPNFGRPWAEVYMDNENEPEPAILLPINNHLPLPVVNADILELCCICFEMVVVVTLVPCGHQFCDICVRRMIQEQYEVVQMKKLDIKSLVVSDNGSVILINL
ncbi:uncharacterized protein LOC132934747 [Metopolophium dirhodum]|uniref:uncharacterized protein LOC132934747 n=1 Tax=Metopolophium dirhodum TaxID=44670 RepID=UPI0029904DD4|nr:uncharacterized protein LOC132934747 [Metopolophium dirhodum]